MKKQRLSKLSLAVRDSTLKRLRAVDEGSENWSPDSGSMSFADIARHLIACDKWLFEKLDDPAIESIRGKSVDGVGAARDEYLMLLDRLESIGKERALRLEDLTEEDLSRMVYDDRFSGDVEFWWIIVRGNLDHEIHHRGQLSIYLKMIRRDPDRQ